MGSLVRLLSMVDLCWDRYFLH